MTFGSAYEITIKKLSQCHAPREALSMTRILFEDFWGIRNRHTKEIMNQEQLATLKDALRRLMDNEPIQYITGKTYFFGLPFEVNNQVLIPRSETEELVYWICLRNKGKKLRILDVGTGSGCIAVSLALELRNAHISACDISPEALRMASRNAESLNADVEFFELDILNSDTDFSNYDLMVSNPPYIPFSEKSKIDLSTLENEPEIALFVTNDDPLIFYRTLGLIGMQANTEIFVETNEFNAEEVKSLFSSQGFPYVYLEKDLQGKYRMCRAGFTS